MLCLNCIAFDWEIEASRHVHRHRGFACENLEGCSSCDCSTLCQLRYLMHYCTMM